MFGWIGDAVKLATRASRVGDAIKETKDVLDLARLLAEKYEDVDDDAKRLVAEAREAIDKWNEVF